MKAKIEKGLLIKYVYGTGDNDYRSLDARIARESERDIWKNHVVTPQGFPTVDLHFLLVIKMDAAATRRLPTKGAVDIQDVRLLYFHSPFLLVLPLIDSRQFSALSSLRMCLQHMHKIPLSSPRKSLINSSREYLKIGALIWLSYSRIFNSSSQCDDFLYLDIGNFGFLFFAGICMY